MTEIEKKALALVNEVTGLALAPPFNRDHPYGEALCRAIEELEAEKAARAAEREQHEAFRQEVSDAVEAALSVFNQLVLDDRGEAALRGARLVFARFIIAKPDPLVQAVKEASNPDYDCASPEAYAEVLRAALAARGLKIVEDK